VIRDKFARRLVTSWFSKEWQIGLDGRINRSLKRICIVPAIVANRPKGTKRQPGS
jgi:hypothetical protein